MEFLLKISGYLLNAWAEAERDLQTNAFTVGLRDFLVTIHEMDDAGMAITFFFFLLFICLILHTFRRSTIAGRYYRRLPNNTEGRKASTGTDLVVFQTEANRANIDHHFQAQPRDCSSTILEKLDFATSLAILNIVLEIISAVSYQIARKEKAVLLTVMLISFTSLLVCLVELVCRGKTEQVKWSCSNSTGRRIPWFYHPPPSNKPFGTSMEMIGLSCAIAQCIVTTINYSLYSRNHAARIEISFGSMIFGFGMLCSRLMEKPNDDGGNNRMDQDVGDIALTDQANLDQPLALA